MNLQNGYKVIYDSAVNNEHTFYASKTGVFADAEEIVKLAAGEYKLVYEKNGCVYGSKTGVPAEGDTCFTEFNKVFVTEDEAGNEPDEVEVPKTNEETPVEDEPTTDEGADTTEEE
jgi:hypothetical protein